MGELQKCHAPKYFERNLFELREFPTRKILIFRGQCPLLSECTKISGPQCRNVAKGEKIEISTSGGLAPKFDNQPPVSLANGVGPIGRELCPR